MFQKSKKALSLAVVIAIVMSMFAVAAFSASAAEDATAPILGDVNLDGNVDVTDATLVQKYAADLVDFTDVQLVVADVNADNDIDVKDATLIQKFAADIPVDYPIGQPVKVASDDQVSSDDQPEEPTTAPEEPTEATEATEASTEATEASTEATEATEASTEATEATTEATEPANTKTIYFDNSKTQWDVVVFYHWTNRDTAIALSPVEGTDNIFSATIDADITAGLFKNLDSVTEWDKQTKDVKDIKDGMMFVPDTTDEKGKWSGNWVKYGEEPATTEPVEDTTVEDTTVEDTTVEDTTVEDTTVEDTTVEDTTTPSEPTTDATPDDATPDEATPDEATPDEATPDEATPDEPETVKIYFNAAAIVEGNEQFAVWAWPDGTNGVWFEVTDEGDKVYSVEVPSYYNVIFVRMDAEGPVDWSSKWTQTATLTIDGTTYVITEQVPNSDQLLGYWL